MNALVNAALSRREFLQSIGALVVCSSVPGVLDAAVAETVEEAIDAKPPLVPTELDSWIAILPDGRVNAFFGKMDMGQCLDVAIAQIVAEELDVAAERVNVLMGDTETSCNQGGGSGSLGVSRGARPLRNAAAEARRILIETAARQLEVPAERLAVTDGVIRVLDDPARTVSYADLIGGRHFQAQVEWNKQVGNFMDVNGQAKPKSPAEYKIVGQPLPRRDVAGKVFGTSDFVTDVRLPRMLHARVLRPPHAGAAVEKIDFASIKKIRSARVVRDANFLAVVAESEWDAVRAARMLKVTWTATQNPFPPMEELYGHIRAAQVVKREEPVKNGDVAAAFSAAARTVEAEYEWPFQSHASMGPACAVADVKEDEATVWTGSQKPHFTRDGVAKLINLPPEKVRGIWVMGPGSYGRNDAGDAALEAAFLSKVTRRPVRVQGMRHDGTGWDPKGPASVHRGRAALDADGKVIAYEFASKGFSRIDIATNESDPRDSYAGQSLGLPAKPAVNFGTPADSYGFEAKLYAWETIPALLERCSPLRTAHLRDPVGPDIHFASEQFIDEIAAAVGADPVAFRLKYITAPRDGAVVRAAAEKAGWEPRPSPRADRSGGVLRGRGIAYAQRGGTIVAVVAEVEVDPASGRIWARKVTVAHDCGLIINPLGLRYTIEGNVVQGLSRTLCEEVRFDRNNVTSVDWASYPILDIQDAPEAIDCVLINRPEVAPTGAGEPTMRCIPAAVANAFFDATGVRLRRAPLTAERVKAALARS